MPKMIEVSDESHGLIMEHLASMVKERKNTVSTKEALDNLLGIKKE